jgi:hypothetical protein
MTPLQAALDYAQMGYRILPLWPGEKRPYSPLVKHGLRDSTTDPATIRAWFRAAPGAGVGILPPAEVLVLDLDRPDLWEEMKSRWPELEEAPRQRTPTKGGLHVFLRLPAGVEGLTTTNHKLPGMDLKGLGKGYLVAAPTSLEAGSYEWEVPLRPPDELPLVPEGLLLQLLPPPPQPPAPLRLNGNGGQSPKRLRALLESYAQAVAAAPNGERHKTLVRYARTAGGLIFHGLDAAEAETVLVEAAMAAGLPEREARSAVLWGLAVGEQKPIYLEGPNKPTPRPERGLGLKPRKGVRPSWA